MSSIPRPPLTAGPSTADRPQVGRALLPRCPEYLRRPRRPIRERRFNPGSLDVRRLSRPHPRRQLVRAEDILARSFGLVQ